MSSKTHWFKAIKLHKRPINFLFMRSDLFGEFLLNLYAVKLVKENYPKSRIYILARKNNIEVLKDSDFIDGFLEYRQDSFCGLKGVVRLAGILRKNKIGCVVSLNPKKEFHLASFLAGVPLRVGYDRKCGFCLNKKIKDTKKLKDKHEVAYNIDLMSLLCEKVYVPKIDLAVDSNNSLSFLGPEFKSNSKYVIIHPFSLNMKKSIEVGFWKNLTQALQERFGKEAIVVGIEQERDLAEGIAKSCGIKNFAGRLTIRNLATLVKHNCFLFVGLDSGPMHLSALLGVPTVGLFKISDPVRWGPFGDKTIAIEAKNDSEFKEKIVDICNFAEKYAW
ncbi:MAG: glycosyltransferase family 9 protein [Candidatus Omnitrophica bacterium]|nr:glycosyltransferase family 9 protein [Candidatus Omnitrophota bacterium]MDD5429436.1 glycosyltransferase family 9 protein [Candidatus Omnitrophota bacterium]